MLGAADVEPDVVIAPANMRQALPVADIGAGELVRPVEEQRYLMVAVAWAVALGATGAKYAILERINKILKSTEMAWQAVGWELDKLREQLPLAVLIDEFASRATAAARWTFISKWRIREQGVLYKEHEAMLARALLAQAPQKHMEKAMDQGMLAGDRPRDYKILRAYFLTLSGRDSRVNVFRPRKESSGTVSAVSRTVRGRSMNEWTTATAEPTEDQTEATRPTEPPAAAYQGDQITGMLAALHRSETEKAILKGELDRIKETHDKQKRHVDREVQIRTAELLKDCQSPGYERKSNTAPMGACWGWQRDGICKFGSKCRFSHEGARGGSGGGPARTAKECWGWQESGSCRHGEDCHFSHAGPRGGDREGGDQRRQEWPRTPSKRDQGRDSQRQDYRQERGSDKKQRRGEGRREERRGSYRSGRR